MSCAKLISCVSSFIVLAACTATEGDFPSLARRSYENNGPITAPDALSSAAPILSAAESAKVDALNARHQIAQAAFEQALPPIQAEALSAAGSPPGTENWVAAHVQLSRLDKVRSDSVAVMREFDSLISEQGKADPALVPFLTSAQLAVSTDLVAQNAEIARLSRIIGE